MDFVTVIIVVALLIGLAIGYLLGKKIGFLRADAAWKEKVPLIRKDAADRSRSVLGGLFSEQLAPYLPDFPYNPNEVRFVGKPIDFIVFKGMDSKEIEEVVFVEVKSGKSGLSSIERKLRDAIKAGKVRWEEYRVDKKVTEK
ncbi:Holliday junction resolvase-like protein [Nanoarchaeota archaeon]